MCGQEPIALPLGISTYIDFRFRRRKLVQPKAFLELNQRVLVYGRALIEKYVNDQLTPEKAPFVYDGAGKQQRISRAQGIFRVDADTFVFLKIRRGEKGGREREREKKKV